MPLRLWNFDTTLTVHADSCIGMQSCLDVCPSDAIRVIEGWVGDGDYSFLADVTVRVDPDSCVLCGECANVCTVFNYDGESPSSPTSPPNIGGGDGPIDAPTSYVFLPSGNPVNLQDLMDCFGTSHPPTGTYEMKLFSDLPVENNPAALTDTTLTPGHTFISLSQTIGGNTVTQVFGFYPTSGKKSVMGGEIDSLIYNDGSHPYNASIKMSLTAAQFAGVIANALALANNQYDLRYFNCTDYALDVFNTYRYSGDRLVVPDTIFNQGQPGQQTNYGTTPNGLYNYLNNIKNTNGIDAPNINIGNAQAPTANGPC